MKQMIKTFLIASLNHTANYMNKIFQTATEIYFSKFPTSIYFQDLLLDAN